MTIYDASMQYQREGVPLVDHRRQGVRLGLVARLGGQGHEAARRARGDRGELRAHPPQQPGQHGRAAAAVPAGRERRLARADRPRGDHDHRHQRRHRAARRAGGTRDGRRTAPRASSPPTCASTRRRNSWRSATAASCRTCCVRLEELVPKQRGRRASRALPRIEAAMPALTAAEPSRPRRSSLGFDLCGIAPARARIPSSTFLAEWLTRGYAGDMSYLGRTRRVRADVRHILPSAQSVIVTATIYNTTAPVFDRDRRSRRGADRALRVGRRLPRGHRRAPGRALAVDAHDAPDAVRGAGLRRHRPDPGARLRAARRHRLDRQEHAA